MEAIPQYYHQQQPQQFHEYSNDAGAPVAAYYGQPTPAAAGQQYIQQPYVATTPGPGHSQQPAAVVARAAAPGATSHSYQQQSQQQTRRQQGGGEFEAPQFLHALPPQLVVVEGKSFSLTSKVSPVSDPSLEVEWKRNGVAVCAGSRINTSFERGFAVLEVLYSIANDTGTYACVARSKSGVIQSNGCYIDILREAGVDRETQLPDQEMVNSICKIDAYLADASRAASALPRDDYDPAGGRPASFLKPLGPQAAINVREGKPIHLETRVAPANDPTLTVDWYRNGVAIPMSCRYKFELDRGFAIFDVISATADDSGQYFCVARNKNGQVQSNAVSVRCLEDPNIVTQSALPPESVSYLNSIDIAADPTQRYEVVRYQEVEEPNSVPVFDIMPENLCVLEKSPAKFLVKIAGKPSPRVMWFLNGTLLAPTTNCRIFNDGAINYLEFHRCEDLGSNVIQVVARNDLGEAMATANLTVNASEDFRPDLRHVMPESTMKRTRDMESIRKSQNAHSIQLKRVDRSSSVQARITHNVEVEQAETLYQNVQSRLRKSERPLMMTGTTTASSDQQQPPSQQHQQQQPQQQVYQPQQLPQQQQPQYYAPMNQQVPQQQYGNTVSAAPGQSMQPQYNQQQQQHQPQSQLPFDAHYGAQIVTSPQLPPQMMPHQTPQQSIYNYQAPQHQQQQQQHVNTQQINLQHQPQQIQPQQGFATMQNIISLPNATGQYAASAQLQQSQTGSQLYATNSNIPPEQQYYQAANQQQFHTVGGATQY